MKALWTQEQPLGTLGVSVLYMLPLSRDTEALLGHMRAFAQKIQEAA